MAAFGDNLARDPHAEDDTFADPEHQGPDRPDDPEAEPVPIIVRPRSRP